MNGYSSSRAYYPNPYTNRRSGPVLSATQGFLNSYIQMRKMLQGEQYRQSLMDYRRSSAERGQKRLGLETRRVELAERRETRLGEEPEQYSAGWFEDTLGYSPETAQILQDRRFGAAPKLRAPTELVRDARMIMENALSEQEYQIGEDILQEAIGELTRQRTEGAPGRRLFEQPRPYEPKIGEPLTYDIETRKPRMLFGGQKPIEAKKFLGDVPSELEPYWDKLSEEDKEDIRRALKRDPASLSEILRRLQQ